MPTGFDRPQNLSETQEADWARAERLLTQLHHRGVFVSALIQTVVDGESWVSEVITDPIDGLTGGAPQLDNGDGELPRPFSWRLELVLRPPFTVALLFEMALEFRHADLFVPEMRVTEAECHSLAHDDELDMMVNFEVA
jgi:hypothetical protein